MIIRKALQIGLLTLCVGGVAGTADARTYHRHVNTVDVASGTLPPAFHRNVRVVNSANRPIRRHGVAGAFERLRRAHMRHRAKLYRALTR